MSASTAELAALSQATYRTYSAEEQQQGVVIDGVHYRIIDQVSHRSGYQGTIYQRSDTGDVIVAHRGTEFDREAIRDGLMADAGMVLTGRNLQAGAALALTQQALDYARAANTAKCQVPSVTVTGHSLGGTLAQISAHRLGLPAETFNAYGAAGLTADHPERDPDIVNHVRATDVVSAASRHIGEVRIYAHELDIAGLARHGYENNGRFPDVRNVLGVTAGLGLRAHYMDNFTSEPGVISAENLARAHANADMIGDYRRDVATGHGALALPRNTVDAVLDAGGRMLGRPRPDPAPVSRFPAGACAAPNAELDPLHRQALDGVHAVDARMGRTPDEASARVAAALYREARVAGLDRIDAVLPSVATVHAPAGATMFAVQGQPGDPAARTVHVPTQQAVAIPVEQSLQAAAAPAQEPPQPVQRMAIGM